MARQRYTVKIGFVPSPELLMFHDRLAQLLDDPAVIDRLLKLAMADTILAEYRKRWIRGLPQALHTNVVGAARRPRQPGRELEQAISRAMEELATAQATDNARRVGKAQLRLSKLRAKYERGLKGESADKLKSQFGKMVSEALKVMRLLTEVDHLKTAAPSRNTRRMGIGHLPTLEGIKTPSRVGSKRGMNILWRHLEFGTGKHALTPRSNRDSPHKLRGGQGEWWFGKTKHFRGILVEGSKPVYALRLYDEFAASKETQEFGRRVVQYLQQALAL